MFCPSAIDWGNAADWVAGTGSLAAVFVAVGIAAWQFRDARRQRLEARNEDHGRKAHLAAEIIRIAGAIEAVAVGGANLVNLGGGLHGLTTQMDEIGGLRLQLKALQDFPQSDPRLFGEIGRIIAESEFSRQFATASPTSQSFELRAMAKKLTERREAIGKLFPT